MSQKIKYAYPREVWWCTFGLNLGTEIDGKNDSFERPAIVMKVYNKEMMVVLPLTTRQKKDPYHYRVAFESKTVWVKLTQMRVISNKRLSRKVNVVDKKVFEEIRRVWIELL